MDRLWKLLDLNHFFIASYAPYHSCYNPIDITSGNMSMALTQITLCLDAKSFNKKDENQMKELINKAMGELDNISCNTNYAEKMVNSSSRMYGKQENAIFYYEEFKDALSNKTLLQFNN